MSKSVVYRHYLRALSRFPKDNLRVDTQFQDFVRRRVDRTFGVAPSETPTASKSTQSSTAPAAPVTPAAPLNEAKELAQVNALYSLVENRYSRKYSLANSLMKPASNPTHYEDLVRELEEAPTRSVWGRMANRWKGFLRLK